MVKGIKRVIASVLISAMVIGGAGSAFAAGSPNSGNKPTTPTVKKPVDSVKLVKPDSAKQIRKVKTFKNGDAAIAKVNGKHKSKTLNATTIKVKGVKYQVSQIRSNALKNCKKIKTVVLGKKTILIWKKAFTGAKNLRTIKVQRTKAFRINKGAFTGLDSKKISIRVNKKMPKKEYKELVKRFRKAGFKGKIQRNLKV